MLKKVAYVSVFVNDQDKALDFYTNVLGFEKRRRQPDTGRTAVPDRRPSRVRTSSSFSGQAHPGRASRYMAACPPRTPSR